MTPEERELLLKVAETIANLANDFGRNVDAGDICDLIEAVTASRDLMEIPE